MGAINASRNSVTDLASLEQALVQQWLAPPIAVQFAQSSPVTRAG
jgi:hypothetical protein